MANGNDQRKRYTDPEIAEFMQEYRPGQEEFIAKKAGVSASTVKKWARSRKRRKTTSRGTAATNGSKPDITQVGATKERNGLQAQIVELKDTVVDLLLENTRLKKQLERQHT